MACPTSPARPCARVWRRPSPVVVCVACKQAGPRKRWPAPPSQGRRGFLCFSTAPAARTRRIGQDSHVLGGWHQRLSRFAARNLHGSGVRARPGATRAAHPLAGRRCPDARRAVERLSGQAAGDHPGITRLPFATPSTETPSRTRAWAASTWFRAATTATAAARRSRSPRRRFWAPRSSMKPASSDFGRPDRRCCIRGRRLEGTSESYPERRLALRSPDQHLRPAGLRSQDRNGLGAGRRGGRFASQERHPRGVRHVLRPLQSCQRPRRRALQRDRAAAIHHRESRLLPGGPRGRFSRRPSGGEHHSANQTPRYPA